MRMLLPLLATFALCGGLVWTDAAILVEQTERSLSPRSTNRRHLRAVTTTSEPLIRATSQVARSTIHSSQARNSDVPSRKELSASSSRLRPVSNDNPLLGSSSGVFSVQQPPTYITTAYDYDDYSQLLAQQLALWAAIPQPQQPPPSPPVRLTVSLVAGVALTRTEWGLGSPLPTRSFGVDVDCGLMAALVTANLTGAAAAAGVRFEEPPAVERCNGTWFSVRVEFGIDSATCGRLSDEVYRDLPRWVNAALGRAPEAAVACGDAAVDQGYVTTAWVYGNGDGAEREGCVALAYAHTC